MHFFTILPVPGGPAAVALAARSNSVGTVIVAVIAIVFVGLIVLGSRPSVMAKYRGAADRAGAPADDATPPAERGRRAAP